MTNSNDVMTNQEIRRPRDLVRHAKRPGIPSPLRVGALRVVAARSLAVKFSSDPVSLSIRSSTERKAFHILVRFVSVRPLWKVTAMPAAETT
jgi:hypothetical protein